MIDNFRPNPNCHKNLSSPGWMPDEIEIVLEYCLKAKTAKEFKAAKSLAGISCNRTPKAVGRRLWGMASGEEPYKGLRIDLAQHIPNNKLFTSHPTFGELHVLKIAKQYILSGKMKPDYLSMMLQRPLEWVAAELKKLDGRTGMRGLIH